MQFAAGRIGLLAALLILTPIAPGQEEGGSLREIKVQEILQAAKGASIPQIWGFAEQLSSLGPSAKRAIQRGLRDASVEGRLAGLKALIDLDSPTFAAEKLSDVARDEAITEQLRVAAIELLGQTDEEDAEDGLLELLLELNPRVKIAAARALWRLGTPRSSNAKKALREFLRSSDVELRTQGTLALAEMGDGDTPGVKQNLIELRKRPDMVGRLADALYHKLNLQRVIQRQEAREDAGGNGRASARWRHLDEVYALLKRFYEFEEEIDEDDLRIRAARGLLNMPADPHTQFLTPAEYEEFLHGNSGVDPSYGGIGAFIDTNVKDSFRILRPIFGGPAWNSDIRGGDDIVAVNGNPTAGRSTTDIIKDVKGPPGTPVVLSIYRTGWDKAREIKVLRAKIVLPTVFSRMLPGKIGYISVAQFAYETGKELRKHMGELEGQGMQGLIL
ncbi:MAG: HEAT repeat domain-containing protein, partial [Planctomycetota bacterium]|nr:HEAT repeat domain-containing protein [Planctomycetota bacterium]